MQQLFSMQNQQVSQPFTIRQNLSSIYHGIQEQLCSKQSTLLNKLKNVFSSLYDGFKPSHYVILNDILQLSHQCFSNIQQNSSQQIQNLNLSSSQHQSYHIDSSIAIQNGIYLLFKKTYLKDKIFINGINQKCQITNSQQLIFQNNGTYEKLNPNQNNAIKNSSFIKQITSIIQLANDSLSLNKLYGGVIYIYSNIDHNYDKMKQSILLAIYFAILSINDNLLNQTQNQIINKLYNSNIFDSNFLSKQFRPYKKGQILITRTLLQNQQEYYSNQNNNKQNTLFSSIQFPRKLKFLYLNSKILKTNKIAQKSSILLSNQSKQQNLSNQNENNLLTSLKDELQRIKQNQIGISNFLLEYKQNDNNQNQNIDQTKLFEILQILNKNNSVKFNKFNQRFINLLENNISFSNNYLVVCQKSDQIHQKIRFIRKYIQKIKSQQQKMQIQNQKITNLSTENTQNPQCLQKRFSSKINPDKILFSAVPSLAFTIFNPQNQIWFK